MTAVVKFLLYGVYWWVLQYMHPELLLHHISSAYTRMNRWVIMSSPPDSRSLSKLTARIWLHWTPITHSEQEDLVRSQQHKGGNQLMAPSSSNAIADRRVHRRCLDCIRRSVYCLSRDLSQPCYTSKPMQVEFPRGYSLPTAPDVLLFQPGWRQRTMIWVFVA